MKGGTGVGNLRKVGLQHLIDHVGEDAGGVLICPAQGVRRVAQVLPEPGQQMVQLVLAHGVLGGPIGKTKADDGTQPAEDVAPVGAVQIMRLVLLGDGEAWYAVDVLAHVGGVVVQPVAQQVFDLLDQRLAQRRAGKRAGAL